MSEFRHISLITKEIVMNMCLATPCEEQFKARVQQCIDMGYFTESEAGHVLEAYKEEECLGM